MVKVGVIGATGYAGAELVRLLSRHPEVELTSITSRQYAGKPISEIYPAMTGLVEMKCEEFDCERFCEKIDYAFTALPHKIPMGIIPDLLREGKKVIDLSADFRFSDVKLYEEYYQPHTAKDILAESVYGLSEVYGERVATARIVGNPGCYPTSILLPLVPLVQQGLIRVQSVIADSKSGVSGAGRSLSLTSHFCEANESFKPYKMEGHRHRPEMEEVLSSESGDGVHMTFIPHLLPANRGMLSTLYVEPVAGVSTSHVRECLENYYQEHLFVRICSEGKIPDIKNVQHTNFCDIGWTLDERSNRLILVSAIDNLIKGAAGQAVQNMNIMLGIDETKGLIL